MKLSTPQISWHNRLPVLCLDITSVIEDKQLLYYKLATGGNDCKVYIWKIDEKNNITVRCGLRRHQRTVGALRFSPDGTTIASGDDDGYIYLWRYENDISQPSTNQNNSFNNDDDVEDLESWKQLRVLRGHVEDICDVTWSRDGRFLLSGSVDNSAILWDVEKSSKIWVSDMISGYVQGVAIDPLHEYMVASSTDRTMRVYNMTTKRLMYSARRMRLSSSASNTKAFFCDDTLQTFCRRSEFSPCGKFLLVPAGQIVNEKSKPISTFFLFKRPKLNRPFLFYTTDKENSLCARFCPTVFKLRNHEQNFWDLPYRLVFAVATSKSIIIYDSQQPTPICYISHLHMARLTDLAWSPDGLLLTSASYDGYCTVISFQESELGDIYDGDIYAEEPKPEEVEEVIIELPKKPEPEPPQPTMHDIRKYMICKKTPTSTTENTTIED